MSVDLTHEFTVPASMAETWAAFDDIESIAGCFPGAVVTSVEGDTFQGSCKVKLGPIALVYNGSGTFVEKDEAAGTMKIQAKGKDKRGNGTAGADVIARLVEVDGGTKVTVVTDLAITGKPAQFGRGVMQDVSDKLLGQFVDCLAGKLDSGVEEPTSEPATAEHAASADAREGADVQDAVGAPGDAAQPVTSAPAAAATPIGQARPGPGKHSDEALDLGATVLPVLLRSYGKQLAGGLGLLVVLVWLFRRLR